MTSKFNEVEDGGEDGMAVDEIHEDHEDHEDAINIADSGSGPHVRRNLEDLLQEARAGGHAEDEIPSFSEGYSRAKLPELDDPFSTSPQESVLQSIEKNFESPDGSVSIPDDTPSLQSSAPSSPGRGLPRSRKAIRPSLSASPQSFERRFQARVSSSPTSTPRAIAPAFLTSRSRQSSSSSQLIYTQQEQEDDDQSPWEVVRWTKLKKISNQAFSEAGKRTFGRPTYFVITASIIIGTSKGIILVFDYQQTLKSIIGQSTKAIEAGAITSLTLSADHSTIASGHIDGSIFSWDISHPARPSFHIPPISPNLSDRKGDGHVSGFPILHIGFLGAQNTAIVSADESGMAFSHVISRNLTVVGRTVSTTRILGRYPEPKNAMSSRKPSSVIAFSPLPLGNVEQPTDDMGLTALLTPYLLVIVSTIPTAQTQYKTPRAKDLAPHSTLSGCLAWFPAVKLRNSVPNTPKIVSKTKLVYCWSNVLTVLEVEISESKSSERGPSLHFQPRSRWKAEEAIIAVQWLSRSVLAAMTITQKLLIIEDNSMRVADSSDLVHKHIYHQDLYSRQLQPLVDQLENDISMHGVVADAFHMSFRAYKGRLFVLGMNDISMGTLSNWADRLMTLMEAGDSMAALQLATAYYNGETDRLTVGLPEDDDARHAMVEERLLEMISASLRFTFKDVEPGNIGDDTRAQLTDLITECFVACVSAQNLDFLFDEVYDWYKNARVSELFFDVLEKYILNDMIRSLPPDILQDTMNYYASRGNGAQLENIVLRLDTSTMDIDQVTTMCKRYRLYDALIFVWNRALRDFITPIVDLLSLVRDYGNSSIAESEKLSDDMEPIQRLFPYFAYTLTGRTYPEGADLSEYDSVMAKADLYGLLFAEEVVQWPDENGEEIRTVSPPSAEPQYPYLRMMLHFDSESFLSMLNEAFVDSFLSEGQEQITNGTARHNSLKRVGLSMNRQRIINILLGVMTKPEFSTEEIIFLDMFLARNVAKFPSFILLRGSTLHQILVNLCEYPTEGLKEDCQLSAEYLLSVYQPADLQSLISLLKQARFFRILKSTYKANQQYDKWLQAHFEDASDQEAVFDCIRECLGSGTRLNARQRGDFESLVVEHGNDLIQLNSIRSADCLRQYAPELLSSVFDNSEHDSRARYEFLKELFEPGEQSNSGELQLPAHFHSDYVEQYVRLMCIFDRQHVAAYIGTLESGDLHLEQVLPAIENSGVVDAAVVLLARDGLARDAMDRLLQHLATLQTALVGLLTVAPESPDVANTNEASDDLVEAIQKYVKLGIWLCQGQTSIVQTSQAHKKAKRRSDVQITEADLTSDELLWLDLLDAVVRLSRAATSAAEGSDQDNGTASQTAHPDIMKSAEALRTLVQQTFTALLASKATSNAASTTDTNAKAMPASDHSFLRILRTFLERASRTYPSLSSLRAVLADIFAAYTFEESILALSSSFLDKDVFKHVEEAKKARDRGWRPRSQICEWCKKRAWGPGAGVEIWEAWRKGQEAAVEKRGREWAERVGGDIGRTMERGKARAKTEGDDARDDSTNDKTESKGPLLVFACSHLYHRVCYELATKDKKDTEAEERALDEAACPLCV